MGSKKMKIYTSDFETTTNKKDLRVWASCCYNIETDTIEHMGEDIEDWYCFRTR